MQFGPWAFVGLLGLVFTLFWMISDDRIPMTTLTGAFLWFVWGFQATSISVGTQTVVTESYPSLEMLGYFLAIVNAAYLLLWLWTDEDEGALDDQSME